MVDGMVVAGADVGVGGQGRSQRRTVEAVPRALESRTRFERGCRTKTRINRQDSAHQTFLQRR
jgi:hypothetical protein